MTRDALGFFGLLLVGGALSTPAMASDAHFRWGVGGGMGYFLPAGIVDFHGEFRAGAQLSENIGVYGEVGFLGGFGFGASANGDGSASVRAKAVGLYHFTPLVEYNFGAPFIAGGVQLGRGGWAHAAQSVDAAGNVSQVALTAGGFLPGIDLRAGIIAGSEGDGGRRKGFSLALDLKIMHATLNSVSQEVGANGSVDQKYQVGKSTFGVTPTLMFGFDAR